MKIQHENIAALPIVYMRRTGAYGPKNFELMENMKQWLRRNNAWSNAGTIYAIAQDNAATTPPEQCRYDVCFVTDETFNDSAVCSGTLPGGEYLVFRIPHSSEAVQQFWGTIGEALASAGATMDESRPILERYQIQLVEQGECEFCLPVASGRQG